MLACELQKIKMRPKKFPFDGSNVTAQKKTPTDFLGASYKNWRL
jgi:hypothetical protein